MLFKLPHQCSGQEIVDAFKAASLLQETSEMHIETQDYGVKLESDSEKSDILSMGVRVFSSRLEKKWIFFGQRIWKRRFLPEFRLEPVVLLKQYETVEIAVEYMGRESPTGLVLVLITEDPGNPKFERIRPLLEKVLSKFLTRLQPNNA
jgi:hypothetical protein